jgi:hypothetical protein
LSIRYTARGRFAERGPPRLVLQEQARGRLHPTQGAVSDAQRATREDGARDDPVAEVLVVLVALGVPVEQPRDRRVPPVDDAQPVVEPRRLAEEDVPLLAPLLQPHVAEVGPVGVDAVLVERAAGLLQEVAQALVEHQHAGALVVIGVAHLIAQLVHLPGDGVDVDLRLGPRELQALQVADEAALLVLHDGLLLARQVGAHRDSQG